MWNNARRRLAQSEARINFRDSDTERTAAALAQYADASSEYESHRAGKTTDWTKMNSRSNRNAWSQSFKVILCELIEARACECEIVRIFFLTERQKRSRVYANIMGCIEIKCNRLTLKLPTINVCT